MTPETFAEAPNGVAKLRELILQLAVQGKLVPQEVNDEPASVLSHECWRVSIFRIESTNRVPSRFVPQGHPTIAQRFIAGIMADERTSPAGTTEHSWSTRRSTVSPSLPSLRDSWKACGVVVPVINHWANVGQPLAGRGAHRS
jgi:hypothetical protein